MKVAERGGAGSGRRALELAWPTDIRGARRVQLEVASRVRCRPLKAEPRLVAGVDAAFSADEVFAAACLYSFPGLEPVEDAFASLDLAFPYIPGYLTFREGPALVEAVSALSKKPDLILVDGQGIAHPRGLGVASQRFKDQVVGAVVRTRTAVKPLFVSPGHLVDIEGAVRMVLRSSVKYRIPEPIRRADALSKTGHK
jgi:deoxyribonuclease V